MLSDNSKYEQISIKEGKLYSFMVKQEQNILDTLNDLLKQGFITNETYENVKPHGTKPGILYGLSKVHKPLVDNLPKLRPIISAIGTPAYKLAKFLVSLCPDLTQNEYTLKDSFEFASIIDQQNHNLFMGSLDVDSLFTNVPLDETINIILDQLYTNHSQPSIPKSKMKKLFEYATKESVFRFNNKYYKQRDGTAMGSPLGPVIANAFLCHHERVWLDNCPLSFLPRLYKRYVDDIFVLFSAESDLILFKIYLNKKHPNIHFTHEVENNNALPFLDVNVTRIESKFSTGIYRKSTFSGVMSNFISYLPSKYKHGLIGTLLFRAYKISNSHTLFHEEVTKLKSIFTKNGYPMKIIDSVITSFLMKQYEPKIPTFDVPKKVITIVLPYLGSTSDSIKKNLRKALRSPSLNCCDIRFVFRITSRLSSYMRFKESNHKDLDSSVLYKYTCRRCNSSYIGETGRHWIARFSEHIGHSARTQKPIKGLHYTAIRHHWTTCGEKPTEDCFQRIGHERSGSLNLRRIQESIYICRDKPSLNKDTYSVPLYLFK